MHYNYNDNYTENCLLSVWVRVGSRDLSCLTSAMEEKLGFLSFSFTHTYIPGCPTKGEKTLIRQAAFAGGGED